MEIKIEVLDRLFEKFLKFIEAQDKKPFSNFQSSQFFNTECYKYSVYDEARENLGTKRWSPEDIGTGRIQEKVSSAIKTRVYVSYYRQMIDNNLVNWRKIDNFSERPISKSLETTLFNLYKSKIKDSEAFEQLMAEKLSYQFIAYLFFIKERQRFMPISQELFDDAFNNLLELPEFKTSGNISWENYETYNRIIKDVQKYLKTKDKNVTLLDAHSFLYISAKKLIGMSDDTEKPQIEEKVIEQQDTVIDEKEIESSIVILDEDEEKSFSEGKEIEAFRLHKRKERNKELVKAVKIKHLKTDEKLCCQVCGFSFVEKYGKLGEGFIEAHHLFPISKLEGETETRLEDIALVCSNCHRMLHRQNPLLTIDELERIIKER